MQFRRFDKTQDKQIYTIINKVSSSEGDKKQEKEEKKAVSKPKLRRPEKDIRVVWSPKIDQYNKLSERSIVEGTWARLRVSEKTRIWKISGV